MEQPYLDSFNTIVSYAFVEVHPYIIVLDN